MLATSLTIQTGSRLHLGIFSDQSPSGRLFRGCGMMIAEPGFRLNARRQPSGQSHELIADKPYRDRLAALLERLDLSLPEHQRFPIRLQLERQYAPHAGLGSGTQLCMATVDAWASLHNRPLESWREAMQLAGRGERSSIGSAGYFLGGFLIDAGKSQLDLAGLVQKRIAVPEAWRILLVRPQAGSGLAGQAEQEAFATLDQGRHPQSQRLTDLLQTDIPQALQNECFPLLASAIDEFGLLVGEQFARVQGGVYASRQATEVVSRLRQAGLSGVGQTSWGPTLFAFCPHEDFALQAKRRLTVALQDLGWQLTLTRPLNTGATKTPSDQVHASGDPQAAFR